MLKILQARLQQYVNWELVDVQAGLRKGKGFHVVNEAEVDVFLEFPCFLYDLIYFGKGIPEKIYFCFIDLTVGITTNCRKFLKRCEYQTTLPASCVRAKKQQLEHGTMDWFKMGKGVYQGCIVSLCVFMQIISCERLGWMKHKLESRLPGEISTTSDMQMTPP